MWLHRTLRIATLLSSVGLAATLLLWGAASGIDPSRQRISCGNYFHVSVVASRNVIDAKLAFFNDPDGPYRGSILSLGKDPSLDRKRAFGERAGIYYRYFHWSDGGELWTLMVSLAYPALAFGVLPTFWVFRRSRERLERGR
jgi:hypothetical protein